MIRRANPSTAPSAGVLPHAAKRRVMLAPILRSRGWAIIGVFALAYVLFTLHLARVQHNCPSVHDLLLAQENAPLMQSLNRMARSINHDSLRNDTRLQDDLSGPLAKLGIALPNPPLMETPPTPHELPSAATHTPTPQAPALPPHPHDQLPVSALLDPHYAPSSVYYVWCGRRWFEFQNYLSVMSVIRVLRPDNIFFYYDVEPVLDPWLYNTWFKELQTDYPFFRVRQLLPGEKACESHSRPSLQYIYGMLSRRGGIYVNEHTVIAELPLWYRNQTMVHALNENTTHGFLMTQFGFPGTRHPNDLITDVKLATKDFHCTNMERYVKANRKPLCVNLPKVFYPKDIWLLENSFGRLVRSIFYGTPEIPRLPKKYDELIPNIAHIVWLGGGEMDMLFYLGVLSLVYVAEVDVVYIHGDGPPSGPRWALLKDHPKVKLIYRETPKTVYGNKIDVISHVTDVWRVDFMLKYGGIYVDTDTIFVKPLDREIRAYDAVGSYDWTDWNPPFPDTINFGVAIGKRGAPYWRRFQESMRWFIDQDWSWNGLRQPYRIQERHPDLVRIDPHLQVICYLSLCHPTWHKDYHNESVHHLNSASITNWREDTYAFHWTLPTPHELLSEKNLMTSVSIFADIGRNVLEKAGLLQEWKTKYGKGS